MANAILTMLGTGEIGSGEFAVWAEGRPVRGVDATSLGLAWEAEMNDVSITPVTAGLLAWATPFARNLDDMDAVVIALDGWIRPLLDPTSFDQTTRRLYAAYDEKPETIIDPVERGIALADKADMTRTAVHCFNLGGTRMQIVPCGEDGRAFYLIHGPSGVIIGVVPIDHGEDDGDDVEPVAPVPFEFA